MSEKATTEQETPEEETSEGEAPKGEAPEEGTASPEGADSPDHPAPGGDDVLAELDHLQEEFQALNDRHLRLAAEFNNYRRRQEAERTEAWARAQADLVRRLVEVLDDLQRVSALELEDESVTAESIVEGIDLVERKFVRALEEAGAEVVEPREGEAFDPEAMEAMMRVADESGERDDQVAAVFQKGYLFRGHLVRPARVSVYKARA